MPHTRRAWSVLAISALAAISLAACAPGSATTVTTRDPSSISTDPSTAGDITLTVWDGESGNGIDTTLTELNKRFEAKYPNVKIERVTRSLADMKTTLKLAMSGDNPPDVAEINQGYSDMATYAAAGLLTDLGPYADVYGWRDRFPSSQLALNSVSADGTQLGTGNLYGVSLTGEIVGVFYNEQLLASLGMKPATSTEELSAQLAQIKAAGVTPIAFGNQDAWPAIHLFGDVLTSTYGAKDTADVVFGRGGSWDDAPVVDSAATVQGWADNGYLTDGFAGQTMDTSIEGFAQGKAAYMIGGVWNQSAVASLPGVRFAVLPGTSSGSLAALGGIGYGWGIPAKSPKADVAAAYINFITDPESMQLLADNQQLPAVPSGSGAGSGQLASDIITEWEKINADNGLAPYLDWTTPTFYDTITQNLQLLLADQITPEAFASALQSDASAFRKK